MTQTPLPDGRRLLSLTPTASTVHGSRSRMTCFYRCGNACDHPEPNTSDAGHVRDEIARAVARRAVLKGAAVGSGALVLGGLAPARPPPGPPPGPLPPPSVGSPTTWRR